MDSSQSQLSPWKPARLKRNPRIPWQRRRTDLKAAPQRLDTARHLKQQGTEKEAAPNLSPQIAGSLIPKKEHPNSLQDSPIRNKSSEVQSRAGPWPPLVSPNVGGSAVLALLAHRRVGGLGPAEGSE